MELDQFKDVYLVIDRANDSFVQKQFVSQGDYKGRSLTVQITNNGSVGEVPGLALNLNWHNEASGLTDLTAFTILDKANSIFRIEYPENMMTPGKVYASIQVIQDGKVTNLNQFELIVQKLAGQPVGIVEKAEFSALVAVLADSNKFRTDIDKKADNTFVTTQLQQKAEQAQADNIQGQVNSLVLGAVGAGNNAEVIQARTDAKGAVFSTVKGHLDNIESYLQTGQTLLAFSDWVVGGVDSATGANSVSTTRIRTDTYKQMPVGKTVNVKVTAGYRVYVLYYNEALAYAGNSGWKTTDFILDTSFANYKFMISAVTEATATIALADFIKISYDLPIFLNDESVTGAKLVDKSIPAEKTTFLNPVYDGNLFDKDNLISGYYLNYQTGVPTVSAGYSYTKEWRECVEGETYSITRGEWQIVYGDANKIFISGVLINGTSFVPPAGAKYFRISVQTAIKDMTMVVKGATLPVNYVGYSKAFSPNVFLRNAKPKIIEVTKDLWGNFQDPAKAIASANEKDTIIIYPGEYESYIDTRDKEISIIGVNKKDCIIYGTSPDYVNPPLEISKGYIANLTIHARKLEGAVATGNTPYAIHPDWDYQANGKLEIFNCELISDWNAAIGSGLKSGFTLHLRDTDLITNEPTNTNGALYFHDSDSPATYGDSFLVVDNCNLKSKSAIAIMPASLGIVDNSVFMTFLRTMMYSDINGKTNAAVGVGRPVTGDGWRQYNNFHLTEDSFGNNIPLFNVV